MPHPLSKNHTSPSIKSEGNSTTPDKPQNQQAMYRVPDHFWETFPDQIQKEAYLRQQRQRRRRRIVTTALAGIGAFALSVVILTKWLGMPWNPDPVHTGQRQGQASQWTIPTASSGNDPLLLSYLEESLTEDEILELAETLPAETLPQ